MTAIERFMNHVKVAETGCWEWQACRNNGYGIFGLLPGRPVLAHRFAYQHFVGAIPNGMELHHRCKNRACVNPDHLDPMTHDEHLRIWGRRLKTHCKHGHEYNETNTIWRKDGSRDCRECKRERDRQCQHRRPAAYSERCREYDRKRYHTDAYRAYNRERMRQYKARQRAK